MTGKPRRNRNCLHEIATAPSGPRNDKSGNLHGRRNCFKICNCQWRSVSAATDAIGLCVFSVARANCKCLPEIATAPSGPRNDTSGECGGAPEHFRGRISLYKALAPRKGDAASVRRQSRQRLRSERRYRRNWFLPFYRQSVRIASVMPGAACRSPTTLHRYSANKQQKQGRTGLGASLFFQLLIPPPAWACRGAYTWSSSRRGEYSHSRCSGTGGRRAACAARRPCTPGRSRAARRPS